MSTARLTLQRLVADTVADPVTGHGYEATHVDFGKRIEITLTKSGAQFVVWLRPADHPSACYRQTGRLKIGHRGDPPDRLGYPLLDALCLALGEWERTLSEPDRSALFEPSTTTSDASDPASVASFRHAGRPALEWLAVRSGLKPACRYLIRPEDVTRIAERARVDGLVARVTDAKRFVESFCGEGARHGMTTLVHVGASERAADAAADTELAMMAACHRGERVAPEQVRALGAALGYPFCCVEAFIPIRDLSTTAIRFHALQRTQGRVDALLNDTIEERALVSHAVCRYDCAPSLRYARALFEAFRRADPGAADELLENLTGLVVAFRTGGSLRCASVTNPASSVYRFDRVEEAGTGPLFDVWRHALSRADGLDVRDVHVRILRGADEVTRLSVRSDDVQIRLFAL